jgi:hypothetical protein
MRLLVEQGSAWAVLHLERQPGPIVFVDDFVGSGEQFIKTWQRPITVPGSTLSFERISSARLTDAYYCPLVCTQYGYDRITRNCPDVRLRPAHILSQKYGALDPDSFIWPSHLKDTSRDFLLSASRRAGIPESGGVDDWRGFHQLSLSIALGDSIPDATLPIFYWEQNGWRPLRRRS